MESDTTREREENEGSTDSEEYSVDSGSWEELLTGDNIERGTERRPEIWEIVTSIRLGCGGSLTQINYREHILEIQGVQLEEEIPIGRERIFKGGCSSWEEHDQNLLSYTYLRLFCNMWKVPTDCQLYVNGFETLTYDEPLTGKSDIIRVAMRHFLLAKSVSSLYNFIEFVGFIEGWTCEIVGIYTTKTGKRCHYTRGCAVVNTLSLKLGLNSMVGGTCNDHICNIDFDDRSVHKFNSICLAAWIPICFGLDPRPWTRKLSLEWDKFCVELGQDCSIVMGNDRC